MSVDVCCKQNKLAVLHFVSISNKEINILQSHIPLCFRWLYRNTDRFYFVIFWRARMRMLRVHQAIDRIAWKGHCQQTSQQRVNHQLQQYLQRRRMKKNQQRKRTMHSACWSKQHASWTQCSLSWAKILLAPLHYQVSMGIIIWNVWERRLMGLITGLSFWVRMNVCR